MPEPTSDKHYEEEFEFPLWKLIKQRAEEKDTSYLKALNELLGEYVKKEKLRYRDYEWENALVEKRWKELEDLAEGTSILIAETRKKGG